MNKNVNTCGQVVTILISLYFIFSFQLVSAQTHPIKNLVFEGAGIRGIAYCGAIEELEKAGIADSVQNVAGTSAGAITALALSLGYKSSEIRKIIGETNFKKLNDGRLIFFGGIHRLKKHFGWYRGLQMEKWIWEIIAAKTNDPEITFEELSQRGYKNLFITGTSINRQRLIIFSKYTYPHMKVKDAVRISMNIPLYFEAVYMDSLGNTFRHPKNKEGLDIMVDGGITGNFPIRIFDSLDNDNKETIGFRIDTEDQIEHDQNDRKLAARKVKNFSDFIGSFYILLLENVNRLQLRETDWARTVSISDGEIGPRIRKLSDTEIETLIENGRSATHLFLFSNLRSK